MKIAVSVDVAVAGHGGACTDAEVDLHGGARPYPIGDGDGDGDVNGYGDDRRRCDPET